MDRPSKPKSESPEKTIFQFGPLRGRPEFFYEHVPLCQEDPNCFRSTCGYCHPRRDSQSTHWSWVYPLENEKARAEPKPLRSAVPPLLFGKQYENTESASLSRDSSFVEDSVILPNLDFLDTSDTPPPHNPWDFNSTDLKNGFDGPSLRKVGSEKEVLKDMKKESKVKNRRIQSSLRTDAPPFQPIYYAPQPKKALEISSPTIPATTPLATSVSSSIPTLEEAKAATAIIASETQEPVEVDEFLRRMEVIKSAAINTPSPSPSKTVNQVSAPTCKESSTPSTPSQDTTTPTVVTETLKVENPEKKPTPTVKVIQKSKSIPVVPPFKSKMTTHTRTEQESLAPLLPLRGGSSTSTTVITEIISPKTNHAPKSLPVVSNLLERDDSSQSIDTGAKAPSRAAWFVVLWSFVCSWIADLGQDIKDLVAFVWATIILRLPFITSTPAPQSKGNSARTMRKPTAAKQFKARPMRSDQNDGKIRK